MRLTFSAILGALLAFAVAFQPADVDAAQRKSKKAKSHQQTAAVQKTKGKTKKRHVAQASLAAGTAAAQARKSAILIDARTGEVLFADRADELRYPASLTKMMTLYLTFDALKSGRLRLDQQLPVSAHAAAQAPSKLNLVPGDTISVEDAILGAAIKSANDAAVVLAEAIGGSEDNFAVMMTTKARQLGMGRTTFRNANGLPNPQQRTTARDMAKLGLALVRDQKAYYHYFGYSSFDFRGRNIPGHNHILTKYDGADGLKTGFINASGFNLVASAKRDGRRLVGAVMGADRPYLRERQMADMFDRGFRGETYQETVVAQNSPSAAITKTAAADLGAQIAGAPVAAVVETSRPDESAAAAPAMAKPETPAAAPAKKAAAKPSATHKRVAAKEAGAIEPASIKSAPTKSAKAASGSVAVQVGAFSQKAAAQAQLASATRIVKGSDPEVVADPTGKIFRARLTGFTPAQAKAACDTLRRQNLNCAVIGSAS